MNDALQWIIDLLAPDIGRLITGLTILASIVELVLFVRTLFKKATG